MKRAKRITSLLAALLLLVCSLPAASFGADADKDLQKAVDRAASYILKSVPSPQLGGIGGDWAVLGLARSGYSVPETYYQAYYAGVERYVKDCGGVLHEKKYSEYSRVILAVSALGKDARSVAGYDLTKPLADYDQTIWQGLNGPIWALVALDCRDYPMPKDPGVKTQASRQMYVDRILACQLPDGGWSLTGGTESALEGDKTADPDVTGMALQALSKYVDQPKVAAAVEKALECVSAMQLSDGGFATWGTETSESAAQIVVGLCELGVSPEDERFTKNGKSVLDSLLSYQTGKGGFQHTADASGTNQLASEQGLYALAAALRLTKGQSGLYDMNDAIAVSAPAGGMNRGEGLPGKNAAVRAVPVSSPGVSFEDAALCEQAAAIEAMAARGIITGYTDGTFKPDRHLTRAEFCAMVTAALGLEPGTGNAFTDTTGHWAAGRISTAAKYGIVAGVGGGRFAPENTITKQEAATMVAAAAALCGMQIAYDDAAIRDVLAPFSDYVNVIQWARKYLAFCYSNGILDDSEMEIDPLRQVTRAEVAQMLFNLLTKANLL